MSDRSGVRKQSITIQAGSVELQGDLTLPALPKGLVAFAHGSGSSRHSSRNRYVAEVLNAAGLATLLLDLLTQQEGEMDEQTGQLRFDIELLAERMAGTVDWLRRQPSMSELPIGLFGASTGAAAALIAASRRSGRIGAVVSRGGRPDLAGDALAQVAAPTLLIVGSLDRQVIELNRLAARQLKCEHQLELIAGATHLFEEPGTLEAAAKLAAGWFVRYL